MRVLLDQQPCESDATSVGEAIAHAATVAEAMGRVIVEVVVDGATWDERQLGSSELCATSANEINLQSANLKELVCQTLADAATALSGADTLQREAAELIQADQRQDGLAKLGDALGIWLSVQEAVVKSAQALELKLDTIEVGDRSISTSIDGLNKHLQSLRDALEAKDSVGLADILMYELPDVVNDWREVLDSLQEHVREEKS